MHHPNHFLLILSAVFYLYRPDKTANVCFAGRLIQSTPGKQDIAHNISLHLVVGVNDCLRKAVLSGIHL
jgi:hypothetical protein